MRFPLSPLAARRARDAVLAVGFGLAAGAATTGLVHNGVMDAGLIAVVAAVAIGIALHTSRSWSFLSPAPCAAPSSTLTPAQPPDALPCWLSCAHLREASARADTILDAIEDPVLRVGNDLRIVYANSAANHLPSLGLATGVCLENLPRAAAIASSCERAIRLGRATKVETDIGASERWDIRCFPLEGGCVLMMRGIAEKRHLMSVLSMNQDLMWRILRALPVGVLTIDATRDARLCNDAAERIFGIAARGANDRQAALRGRDAETGQVINLGDWASVQGLLAPSGTAGRTIEIEQPTGGPRIISVSTAPLPGDHVTHRSNGAVLVVEDVTARVLSERAMTAAMEQAKRADLAKTRFLSAANHDLRQPVQSLVLLMHLVERAATDTRQKMAIGKMREAIGGINLILDALLEVSRLDAGDIQPDPKGFALAPLLARLHSEFAPRAAARGLSLRILPTRSAVRSDPDQLERMLRKLIENAIKYTRSGGVLIGCRKRRGRLAIEVSDTGIGIPEDQIEAIFEDYHQVGNPQRDRGKGLGLGLAVVRRTASLLGHSVHVRSRMGRGSRFIIEVPIAMPMPPIPASESANGAATVLVIDDDPLIRISVCALLDYEGYATIEAEDASEAVIEVRRHGAPDAIIADYRLPEGATGVQAIEAVFATVGRRLPAMILTGDTVPERITEARASGFDLMHKPVAPEALIAAVHRMLPAPVATEAA